MTGVNENVAAGHLYPEVASYVEKRSGEFDAIADEREAQLEQVSEYVRQSLRRDGTANLTFVCTHNSRRSQLAQLWAAVAASHYAVGGVKTFSGGTEVTAFNRRTVETLRRSGLMITAENEDADNPHYQIRYEEGGPPGIFYSKTYDSAPNPRERFCAVMTCSQADQACPAVNGSDTRIALTYEDPKQADDTPGEWETYDERSRQIAREMLYMMSRVAD